MAHSELVQALSRGLELLEWAAQSDAGLSVTETAQRLGVKPPTAHNLIRTLTAKSFLEKTGKPPRYVLGPALGELVQANGRRSLLRKAEALMPKLAKQLKSANVVFVEARGGEVYSSLRVTPERPGTVLRPVDQVMSPYSSASALTFMAWWPEEKRAAYRQRYPFAEYGAHLWKSKDELEAFLTTAVRRGRVVPPISQRGFIAAVPIFGRGGEIIAAVALSAQAQNFKGAARREAIDALADLAAQLSQSGGTDR